MPPRLPCPSTSRAEFTGLLLLLLPVSGCTGLPCLSSSGCRRPDTARRLLWACRSRCSFTRRPWLLSVSLCSLSSTSTERASRDTEGCIISPPMLRSTCTIRRTPPSRARYPRAAGRPALPAFGGRASRGWDTFQGMHHRFESCQLSSLGASAQVTRPWAAAREHRGLCGPGDKAPSQARSCLCPG